MASTNSYGIRNNHSRGNVADFIECHEITDVFYRRSIGELLNE